jgi:G patch domain/KOW motif-containing protein
LFNRSYTPVEPQIRPKGLGLGAEVSVKQQISKISQNIAEEELQLKKGSFVCVEFGPHKGSYGMIEDFDDDLSRVTVKLTIKKESIKIPIALLRVVPKNEFQSESKVINKAKYEDYKKMENNDKNKSQRKHSSHSKDRHESDRNPKRSHSDIKTSNSDIKNERSPQDINKQSTHNSWLLPNLKVRIIDKNYKNGKYYKEKVDIIDVLTPTKCCCKTYDKKLLDDIDLKMLETVIPRQNDSNIMILFGKYKQQLGLIVDRDKSRSEAKVQLLSDKRKILTFSYDQICQFVNNQ